MDEIELLTNIQNILVKIEIGFYFYLLLWTIEHVIELLSFIFGRFFE